MKNKKFLWIAALLALGLAFSFGAGYAVTVAVDGVRESAWDVACHIPGYATDPDEAGITMDDIASFQWTNDNDNMYFLTRTYSDVVMTGIPRPAEYICLDTDNNSSTGGIVSNCNGMVGVDRTILVKSTGTSVYSGAPTPANLISTASAASAWQTTYIETRVDRASLGLGDAYTCNQNIRAAIFFDNGVTDPEDTMPDSGYMWVGCGAPSQ